MSDEAKRFLVSYPLFVLVWLIAFWPWVEQVLRG
jgi:hypothetical protein